MTTEHYDIGDQPTVIGTFREIGPPVGTGDLADPSAITVRVRQPDGIITDYDETACSHLSTGVWSFTLPAPLDAEGIWTVKMSGTATIVAAEEISWIVDCGRID